MVPPGLNPYQRCQQPQAIEVIISPRSVAQPALDPSISRLPAFIGPTGSPKGIFAFSFVGVSIYYHPINFRKGGAMSGINKVTIVGRVGRDPEIRSLRDGAELANLSVATSETWRDRSTGERKEKTEWHRITVWGEQTVRIVRDYVAKGDMLGVEGQLETRKWQDKDGQDRYSTEIVVKPFRGAIHLLGGSKNSDSSNRLRDKVDSHAGPSGFRSTELDDEIPF